MRKQHEEELANLTKEASDWQSKFLEAQKELSNCKKATAKAAEKHQESFTLLKQNLESQIEFQLQEINSLKENLSIVSFMLNLFNFFFTMNWNCFYLEPEYYESNRRPVPTIEPRSISASGSAL